MNLTQYITKIRLDLKDVSEERFTEDEVTRALERAINDLNRWVPRERIKEFRVDSSAISETIQDVGTKPSTIQLSHPQIRFSSLTVTGFVEHTDYEIDYANGQLLLPADSNIADNASIDITYSLANIAIDISDLEDFVSVGWIEYPVGQVPQADAAWRNWGDLIYIVTNDTRSQAVLTSNAHVALYYYALHIQPDANSDGSIPENLAEVAVKGSGAYLLLAQAINLEFDATDRLDAATDTLALVPAAQTALEQALSDAADQLTAALAVLATINDELMGISNSALADLNAIDAIFNQVDDDLADVTDQEVTALTMLSDAMVLIGDMITGFTGASDELTSWDNTGPGIAQYEDKVSERADEASDRIRMSDDLINAVNVGLDPASKWVDSAAAMNQVADQHGKNRDGQIQWGLGFIQAANVWVNWAREKVEGANSKIQAASVIPALEAQRNQIAQTRLEKARVLVERANGRVNISGALAKLADSYVQAALGFVQLAAARVQEIDQIIRTAEGYLNVVSKDEELAVRFREEGTARLTEFRDILQDRNQVRRDRAIVPVRQPR